ncbi:MAG: shikimate dehydrogenase [Pseudomonadales bacterium]|nr:shikimate dehydrogenase [Pseudomonadales bacterium]
MDRYGVMGNPIKHSLSPSIHRMFAETSEQNLCYEAMLVAEDAFKQAVEGFSDSGGKGLNVTVPFKEQAWQLATKRSQRAELAGAVNTLSFVDGEIFGENTDGVGLVTDILNNHHGEIKGKRILIVGAGGAVRGILAPILAEQPAELVLVNRTVSKAEGLAEHFQHLGKIHPCGFDALDDRPFDCLINGSSASLGGQLPPLPSGCIAPHSWCYDMMYGAEPTPFNVWAEQQGAAKVMDGLGMLVEQAAEAFFIWRHVRPKTSPVLEALRNSLS